MEHEELETSAEMLGVLCRQAGLDARDTLLVMSGKRSLQVGNVAVSLAGSAASYDGRFPVADSKATHGQKDLGDLVADALERGCAGQRETAAAPSNTGLADAVADRLEVEGWR